MFSVPTIPFIAPPRNNRPPLHKEESRCAPFFYSVLYSARIGRYLPYCCLVRSLPRRLHLCQGRSRRQAVPSAALTGWDGVAICSQDSSKGIFQHYQLTLFYRPHKFPLNQACFLVWSLTLCVILSTYFPIRSRRYLYLFSNCRISAADRNSSSAPAAIGSTSF